MMKLLLGGTSDSTAILEVLDRLKIDVTSSVVTDYGRHLASKYGQPVIQGRLTAEDMVAFIKENDVDEIIDATHPFADIVSKEAIRAAEMAGVSYLRFERQATLDLSGAIVVHSTQEAIEEIAKRGYKTVYLGTGSKTLPLFVKGLPEQRIVVRVLPTSEVLLACEQLGLVADQIDAIKALLDADQIVIACGGGGIPVLEQDNHLKGASAVIEKDLAAGKLAEGVDADLLIILTNVEQVRINMGKDNEELLGHITLDYSMDETVLFKSLGVYKCSPGIIINSEVGTNVAAAASGVVTDVAELSETGTTVTVSIGNGYETTTGMIENVNLKKGDKVTTGQLIGTVASPSAYYIEEGPGVYFKLTQYGEPVNPDAYFVE